ncbi:MAG TPA: hypothetical protein VLB04_09965 [Methanotrichaceae archaeon]|nr:hypothetical protein [Methanotrichaceae archaeon]
MKQILLVAKSPVPTDARTHASFLRATPGRSGPMLTAASSGRLAFPLALLSAAWSYMPGGHLQTADPQSGHGLPTAAQSYDRSPRTRARPHGPAGNQVHSSQP